MYYARLFPYSLLCKWLSYDPHFNSNAADSSNTTVTTSTGTTNNKIFSRREFSFTLEPVPGEEIYIRYQSFQGSKELKTAVQRRQPRKIDIGAVFSHPPKDKNAYVGSGSSKGNSGFRPVQRELVFDIDLTDYDEVRRCGCTGAKICRVCWTFMTAALKVLDQGLREDFGFKHIAWFYSGRRGIHAWVCDESARNLSDEARSAVATYFEISLNKKNEGLYNGSNGAVHPMVSRAYKVLEPYFCRYVLPGNSNDDEDDSSASSSSMVGGHGLLASRDAWEDLVLDTLPTAAKESVGELLKKKWSNPRDADDSSPVEKWKTLLRHLRVKFELPNSWPSYNGDDRQDQFSNNKNNKRSRPNSYPSSSYNSFDKDRLEVMMWPMDIIFKHTYPRLDINVSKMQNHLLKSPFCVHPKTGRVCVPIDPNAATTDDENHHFNPFNVPTLAQLASELDEYHNKNKDDTKNNAQEEGESNDTCNTKGIQHEWEKTSLKGYFEIFEKCFLQPLEQEWSRKRSDKAE